MFYSTPALSDWGFFQDEAGSNNIIQEGSLSSGPVGNAQV